MQCHITPPSMSFHAASCHVTQFYKMPHQSYMSCHAMPYDITSSNATSHITGQGQAVPGQAVPGQAVPGQAAMYHIIPH